ncbi:ferredoxin family 2Fe-2S iron-sulfur cluster binding protein [Aspergillus foveolatus]|uniref:ferredoxin family 2Fe-2S iron-sulfur cluster binding protein n=1 Tax=Aspergillus foveolatus TaxID=210207 RepID=UPI003CCD9C31
MTFWKEGSLNLLRHAAAGERTCRSQSARFVSYSSRAQRIPWSSRMPINTAKTPFSRKQLLWKQVDTPRSFSATTGTQHGHITPPKPGEEINVSFIDKDGEKFDFQVSEGDNLLDIAQANDLEMEGACGGSCACSTCHVIVEDPEMFDKMEEPSDDENDMLDLAFGLTETSRLGCQVQMSKELDGLVVRLPSMTRNLQASDFQVKN